MTTTVRETERKYDVAAGVPAMPDIAGIGAGFGALSELDALDLHAVYFDTLGLDLLRAGVTLRHRTGGDDAGWTLKLPAGPDTRDEIRVPGDRDRFSRAQPPTDLTQLVRAFTKGLPLGPVATLDTRRRRSTLLDATGRRLAEVVDDQVRATPEAAPEHLEWREVEVELGDDGDTALLDVLERRLLDAGMTRSDAPSKLSRTMAGSLAPLDGLPAARERRPTAGECVLDYLRTHTASMLQSDPRVRLDTADAVHRMRVSSRRIRSALQAYGAVLDPGGTKRLIHELRWLGRALGAARDLEMVRARLEGGLARDHSFTGEVTDQLHRFFDTREAAARTEVLAALDSARYVDLLRMIDVLLEFPPLTTAACSPAGTVLPAQLEHAAHRLGGSITDAYSSPDDQRDTRLHTVRKVAKRLGYAAEVAAPVLGRQAAQLVAAAESVQGVLGERQDALAARQILLEIASAARHDHLDTSAYCVLHELETAAMRVAEDELPGVWSAAVSVLDL